MLVNRFLKLRIERINLTSHSVDARVPSAWGIAAERDVKPIAFLAFDDKVTSRKILGV